MQALKAVSTRNGVYLNLTHDEFAELVARYQASILKDGAGEGAAAASLNAVMSSVADQPVRYSQGQTGSTLIDGKIPAETLSQIRSFAAALAEVTEESNSNLVKFARGEEFQPFWLNLDAKTALHKISGRSTKQNSWPGFKGSVSELEELTIHFCNFTHLVSKAYLAGEEMNDPFVDADKAIRKLEKEIVSIGRIFNKAPFKGQA